MNGYQRGVRAYTDEQLLRVARLSGPNTMLRDACEEEMQRRIDAAPPLEPLHVTIIDYGYRSAS